MIHDKDMTNIISVSITKGGTGKTVTSVNLSAGLAKTGKKVLLVDTDTQGKVSAMLGIQPENSLASLIDGFDVEKVVLEARENLWVIPGGRSLAHLKSTLSSQDTLQKALSPFEGKYHYIIIDSSPGWDALTVNVLYYAKDILAPVSLEVLTIQALIEYTNNIKAIQKHNKRLTLKYILPTFLDRRVKKSGEILEQLKDFYGDAVCDPIRYNVKLSESPGYNKTIFEYSPKSAGSSDYKKLVEKIIGGGK